MNVLSVFDGMSCGRIALERVGIPVTNYYSSEVDKNAIIVSENNYPDVQRLGDVTKINGNAFNGVHLPKIDLFIGGSPCQGFSFAGKQLNFNDPRSKLFWEYVRILKELRSYNPEIKFLLENVRMKKEYLDVITDALGVEPIMINSALVSAQNRKRYFWTNIPNVTQPTDKGILLKDIVHETFNVSNYVISEKHLNRIKTSTDVKKKFTAISPRKALCMTARQFANWRGNYIVIKSAARRGRGDEIRKDNKSNCLLAGGHQSRWLSNDSTLYRKLTPIECERLQTVPDNFTAGVSDSQRYRMLGNGWTVDVIAHIFEGLK